MPKKIRVLHLTTHNEECGIARYQEQFIAGMHDAKDIDNVFFDVSPNVSRFMSPQEYATVLNKFEAQLRDFDILHIQHELSFYKHKELESVIGLARRMGKKVIVTIHTALDVEYKRARLKGLNMHGLRAYAAAVKAQKNFERVHIIPLKQADLIVVHNNATRQSLIDLGFKPDCLQQIRMPVPKLSFTNKTDAIKRGLKKKRGDIILCTVGFITRSKGIDQAVRALTELPDNYKLAIIGGLHPKGGDAAYLQEINDYIKEHRLSSRVYITGFIDDDDRHNALIRECDICVYPYDAHYYSYVSSAALSNALANHRAVVAYKTLSLLELNSEIDLITFCEKPDYRELAEAIRTIDVAAKQRLAKNYAERYAYDKEAARFADIYRRLAA